MFNSQRHENLYISIFVDTLCDSGKKVKILKLLRENSIVFSFIIREKNILFTETQGKNCENSVRTLKYTHIPNGENRPWYSYSNRFHDLFIVSSKYEKDIYAKSFPTRTARLWILCLLKIFLWPMIKVKGNTYWKTYFFIYFNIFMGLLSALQLVCIRLLKSYLWSLFR